MLFGRKDRFAIEATLVSDRSPHEAWGSSCIYAGGVRIGDLAELHCGLAPFASMLLEASRSIAELRSERFSDLSDAEVYAFLSKALFTDDGRSIEEMQRDWDRFGRFNFLTNVGEQFDGWRTFIFSRDVGSLTILASEGDGPPTSFQIHASEFIAAVAEFRAWFDTQVEVVT